MRKKEIYHSLFSCIYGNIWSLDLLFLEIDRVFLKLSSSMADKNWKMNKKVSSKLLEKVLKIKTNSFYLK